MGKVLVPNGGVHHNAATMPVSLLQQERPLSARDNEADEQVASTALSVEELRASVHERCFNILSDAFSNRESVMSGKDVTDFMKGLREEAFDGAGFSGLAEKKKALQEMEDHARNFARETITLGSRILKEVKVAKGDDFSEASRERWLKRLKARPNREEWPEARRKIMEFLDSKLPRLRPEWRKLASDIKEVKTLAKVLGVTATEVPILGELESQEFRDAKFPVRRRKVDRALTILRGSRDRKGTFYATVRTFLEELAEEGVMAKTKIGEWILRTFVGKSPAQAKRFFQTTLRPYAERWREARERYDLLHARMRNDGTPRGFRPCPLEAFLQKSYDQRIAYLGLLKQRLDQVCTVTRLHSDIWHALDAEDWYDAERLLAMMEAEEPDNPDRKTMVQYLASHRDDVQDRSKESEEAMSDGEILTEANLLLKRYPEMDILLKESMEKDTENPQDRNARTRLVGRMMYNLVWAERHGYTDEEEQLRDLQDDRYKKQTQEYIEEGHSRDIEKNMVWGDTAQERAIREDCTSAQIIYMESDPKAQFAVFHQVDKLKDSERFGYWSDLKPISMPLSRHHTFVEEDSKRLKWLMWQMHDRKMTFKRTESPTYRSDA